jgi:hypothetical protein
VTRDQWLWLQASVALLAAAARSMAAADEADAAEPEQA